MKLIKFSTVTTLLLIIMLIAVYFDVQNNNQNVKNPRNIPIENVDLYIIDGCEYIVMDSGNCSKMAHKGNCRNPIHWRN